MSISFRELERKAVSAMTADERSRFERALNEEEQRREVAEAVYCARIRADLTQETLAERAGVSRATVVAVEEGARLPSIMTLTRIARATNRRLRLTLAAR